MSDFAIQIRNLSKAFRNTNLTVNSALLHALGRKPASRILWSLKDIDLEVRPGESLGLVGENGAGKTTLLKIVAGILHPCSGEVRVYGAVGSLLELGTGFHPDLSGRDNVFLNGLLLGMPIKRIRQQFDEIVDFSGVERFLDTPVKYYSSGMYLRLAFAIAVYIDTEILLLDEVLAVGDMNFRDKCLKKIKEMNGQGRTILFVSHDLVATQSLCERAILIEDGSIQADDNPYAVSELYVERMKEKAGFQNN